MADTTKFNPADFGATPTDSSGFNPADFGAIPINQEDQFHQAQTGLAHSQSIIDNLPKNVKAEQATFPTSGGEGVLSGAGAALGNIPGSAYHFGKSLIDFFNPIKTGEVLSHIPEEAKGLIKEAGGVLPAVEATAKEIPGQAYQATVPLFLQHLFSGDTEKAQATLQNDPVGQLAPLLLLGKMAAEKVGSGAQFDNAISTIAKPVTTAGTNIAEGAKTAGAQVLGAETGAGAASIKRAFGGGEEFRGAMRGQVTPEETINQLQNAFNQLKQNRADEYTSKLKSIAGDKQQLDISPITDELQKQLDNFRVTTKDDGTLDFSRSPIRFDRTAQSDVQNIVNTMEGWGKRPGDTTPVGVDTLKRAFGDLYSDSSNVRAFTQAMKNTTKDVLTKNVPDYEAMTKGYAKTSDLLDDIRSATGIGGRAKADAIFTKITTALKADKEFRLQMLNELDNASGQKLSDAIAGHNLSKWVPSGLIGRGMDVGLASSLLYHVFHPAMIPALLTTSPRIVGEFLNASGVATKYVAPILKAVNTVAENRTLTGIDTNSRNNFQNNIDSLVKQTSSGFTFNPRTGQFVEGGTKGYSVGLYPEYTFSGKTENVKKSLEQFYQKTQNLYDKGINMGGYYDANTKTFDLDPVGLFKDKTEALNAGKKYNQKSIYGHEKGEVIDTGGTGENIGNFGKTSDRYNENKEFLYPD